MAVTISLRDQISAQNIILGRDKESRFFTPEEGSNPDWKMAIVDVSGDDYNQKMKGCVAPSSRQHSSQQLFENIPQLAAFAAIFKAAGAMPGDYSCQAVNHMPNDEVVGIAISIKHDVLKRAVQNCQGMTRQGAAEA